MFRRVNGNWLPVADTKRYSVALRRDYDWRLATSIAEAGSVMGVSGVY
jgi:hypothetical protein